MKQNLQKIFHQFLSSTARSLSWISAQPFVAHLNALAYFILPDTNKGEKALSELYPVMSYLFVCTPKFYRPPLLLCLIENSCLICCSLLSFQYFCFLRFFIRFNICFKWFFFWKGMHLHLWRELAQCYYLSIILILWVSVTSCMLSKRDACRVY